MKIHLENLSFAYQNALAEKREVLKKINLTIAENEIIGILGQSGSGKTTLIQHFNGLLKPTRGKIYLNEKAYWTKEISMAEIRRKVGLVFQFPENQFFEETVFAEIAFGLQNLGGAADSISAAVQSALELVRLDYSRMHGQNPHLLSAGEKRRVALASIIAMQPEFLVLDEPTAGLDLGGINTLKSILNGYLNDNRSVVIVSHNLELLFELVQRLVILHQGRIVFDGKTETLLHNTENFTKWGLVLPRYLQFLSLVRKKNRLTIPTSKKELLSGLDE